MPVHIYRCDVCGKRYELHRRFGEPHPTVCPEGHPDMHRIFSPPSIIFKGSGFYVTDNGKNRLINKAEEKSKESSTAEKEKPEAQAKQDGAESKAKKDGTESKAKKEGAGTKAKKEGDKA